MPLFDLLIPNDLDDEALARYVREKFSAFAQPSNRTERGRYGRFAPIHTNV